jgi:hypothetical protein
VLNFPDACHYIANLSRHAHFSANLTPIATQKASIFVQNMEQVGESITLYWLRRRFMAYKQGLTRGQVVAAFAIAGCVDLIQLALDAGFIVTIETVVGPVGLEAADVVLDLMAGVTLSALLGFHLVFLPTFVVETIPVLDAIPTWTAAVGFVLYRHKHQLEAGSPS